MTGYFAALHMKAIGSAAAIRAKPDSLYGSSPATDFAASVPRQDGDYAAGPGPDELADGRGTVARPVLVVVAERPAIAPEVGSHKAGTEERHSSSNWSAEAMSLQIRALEQDLKKQHDASASAIEASPEAVAPSSLRASSGKDRDPATTAPDQAPAAAPLVSDAKSIGAQIREDASPHLTRRSARNMRQHIGPDMAATPVVAVSPEQAVYAPPAQANATHIPSARHGRAASPVAGPTGALVVAVPTEGDAPKQPTPGGQSVSADDPRVVQPGPLPPASDTDRSPGGDQSQISRRLETSIVAGRVGEGAGQRPRDGISLASAPSARQSPLHSSRHSGGASSDPVIRDLQPSVQVSIGRIEIREQRPLPPAPARRPPSPRLGLRDYLDRRLRGGRDE